MLKKLYRLGPRKLPAMMECKPTPSREILDGFRPNNEEKYLIQRVRDKLDVLRHTDEEMIQVALFTRCTAQIGLLAGADRKWKRTVKKK